MNWVFIHGSKWVMKKIYFEIVNGVGFPSYQKIKQEQIKNSRYQSSYTLKELCDNNLVTCLNPDDRIEKYQINEEVGDMPSEILRDV